LRVVASARAHPATSDPLTNSDFDREPFDEVLVLLVKARKISTGRNQPMDDPAEKFLRFAAECELMAKFTRSPENKTVWTRMAERWVRCARLYDRRSAMHSGSARRHRAPVHSSAH
jgi:hypothetical protein